MSPEPEKPPVSPEKEAEREAARRNQSLAVHNCVVIYMDGTVLPLHVDMTKHPDFIVWDLVLAELNRGGYDSQDMAGFLVFQHGVHPDVQRNGCQIEDVLKPLIERAQKLNAIVPSEENEKGITHMREGLMWFNERTRLRRARGVEGSYKK